MDRNLQFLAPLNGINEKRLRYFYTVMMFGSMRKAADILNIEQSAMSRQIQLFESELKINLFKRKGGILFRLKLPIWYLSISRKIKIVKMNYLTVYFSCNLLNLAK